MKTVFQKERKKNVCDPWNQPTDGHGEELHTGSTPQKATQENVIFLLLEMII